MYFYLYDSSLQNKNNKYAKDLDRLETRLTDMGIAGKIGKLSILNNAKELIRDAAKKGSRNVIVVGNDDTLATVFEPVFIEQATLGYIPMGDGPFRFAEILGMPKGEGACESISKRIVEYIDLGKINEDYFMFYASFGKSDVVIESPQGYRVMPLEKRSRVLAVNCNCPADIATQKPGAFIPTDGIMEVLIAPTSSVPANFLSKFFRKSQPQLMYRHTILPFSEIAIRSNLTEEIPITLDGHKIIKTPANISVLPRALKIIVGKERRM